MLVKCELCGATYNVSDDKVKGKSFRFSCKNCGNTVHVKQEAPTPAVETPVWYVAWAKDRKGPFTVEQLQQLLLEAKPAEDVYAWKAGFQNWVKLAEIEELQSVVKALAAPEKAPVPQPEPPAAEVKATAETEKKTVADTAKPESEADASANHRDTITKKLRPSFTDLVAAKAPVEAKKETGKIDKAKVDLAQLASKAAAAAPKDSPIAAVNEAAAKAPGAQPGNAPVIKQYVPPEKKKLPVVQWVMLSLLVLGAVGVPLTLNLYHVIEIPGITKVPLIGGLFKVEEVDHYAKLRDQWEMLVKIDEAKIKLQALKEEEFEKEKQRKIDEEERQRREERRQRLLAYRNANRSGNGKSRASDEGADFFDDGTLNGSKVTEVSFGEEENVDVDFETGSALEVNNIQRKEVLTQEVVSGVIRGSMGRIGACVAEQKRKQPMPGTLMVNFTINRRGTVVSAQITTPQYEGSFVGDCIANVIENLHFPKSGGSINMSYPFSIQ